MKINVNGIELEYSRTGSGSPLILLHGNGEDHHIFDKLSVKLKDRFELYAVDSRNHGKSSKTDDYSYETMAEDIFSFLNVTGLRKASILGFSDGAIIGLILALNHPEAIEKMALLGVNLKPQDLKKESYDYVVNEYKKTKNPLFKLMLEEPDIELEKLKEVKIPSLIVAAENDIFYEKTYTNMVEKMPCAELLIMKGHTHDSYIVNNDILYTDLVTFFEPE